MFALAGRKSRDKQLINADPLGLGIPSGCRPWLVHPKNHDRLIPVGAVGELVIEGYTVGREYLGDAAKTAASFRQGPGLGQVLRRRRVRP